MQQLAIQLIGRFGGAKWGLDMDENQLKQAIKINQKMVHASTYLILANAVFVFCNSAIMNALPELFGKILSLVQISVMVAVVIYMISLTIKQKQYPLPYNYRQTKIYKDIRRNSGFNYYINALILVLSIASISIFISKNSESKLPLVVWVAIFGIILIIALWIFEMIGRSSNELPADEYIEMRNKTAASYGFYLGQLALLALLLTMIWMPEAKAQLIKYSHGYEVEIAISFSILALFIGGLLGRFVTWDKYR